MRCSILSGVILRNQPPPLPHFWGPGRRKWNSSGKEGDVAGGQAPAPAQAGTDASAAASGRQSPRTWRRTMSCSFPATPPSFLFGVNSFWVVSHPKTQCRWGQCVFPQTKSLRFFPDWDRRNLNIPDCPLLGQYGRRPELILSLGPPRWPGIPVSAGAKETAPITREPCVWIRSL